MQSVFFMFIVYCSTSTIGQFNFSFMAQYALHTKLSIISEILHTQNLLRT